MSDRPWDRRAARSAPKRTGRSPSGSSRSRSAAPARATRAPEPVARSPFGIAAKIAGGMVLVVVTLAALSLVGFPTRTFLDQRRVAAVAERQLAELEAGNADAEAQVEALQSDAEIEKLAREDYGYAKAGEEVYRVLPPARDPVRVPDAWPFNGLGTSLAR